MSNYISVKIEVSQSGLKNIPVVISRLEAIGLDKAYLENEHMITGIISRDRIQFIEKNPSVKSIEILTDTLSKDIAHEKIDDIKIIA